MMSTARDRQDRVEFGILLDGGEFLVCERNRSGQPHACAEFGREIEVGHGLADGGARGAARLERGEIENRLDLDEAAQVARLGLATHQHAPGEACGFLLQHVLDGVGQHVHRPDGVVELDAAAAHPRERERNRLHDAAQAWIVGEDAHQRPRLRQLDHHLGDVVDRSEQQPVLLEERPAAGLAHGAEVFAAAGQSLGQQVRGALGQFRRGRLDDRDNEL
jgi:hypothetical protein